MKIPHLPIVALIAVGGLPSMASASPRLQCDLTAGGTHQVRQFVPVSDPYTVAALPLGRHFRFKAVVFGDGQQIEYVKLYSYYVTERKPVLLHEAKFLKPAIRTGNAPAALTGVNTIYSPNLERQFQYGCALLEVDR